MAPPPAGRDGLFIRPSAGQRGHKGEVRGLQSEPQGKAGEGHKEALYGRLRA